MTSTLAKAGNFAEVDLPSIAASGRVSTSKYVKRRQTKVRILHNYFEL